MKVKWTPFAMEEMLKIAKYICENFGKVAKDKFLSEVYDVAKMLGRDPDAGKREPILEHRAKTYRSFVVNMLNKIVYFVDNNHIEIADFWAARQSPDTLANRVK